MAQKGRKWGTIPDWMIKAPVTLLNYDQKAEHYGVKIAMLKDNWPFVSNDADYEYTADRAAWEDYFWMHLHGWPASYKLFREGKIKHYNLPAPKPDDFDPRWQPLVRA